MPQYNSRKKQFDPNELDPCIAAEVRFKKQYFTMNEAKCVLCFVIFVLSVLLLAAGIMMIFQGSNSSSDFGASHNINNDPASQLVDMSSDYYEKEDYEIEENFKEQKPASDDRETKGTPLFLAGPIHTAPIQQSKIKILPNKLIETSEFDYNLKFTTSSPFLPNKLEEEPSKRTTTTSKTSAIYSMSGDKTPDLVPIFKRDEIGAYQRSLDHINTSKIEQNCEQYRLQEYSTSGVYKLLLPQTADSFETVCLMESDYAWTVLQRRIGPDPPFWNASFEEYAQGFGSPSASYWLGLEKLHAYVALNNKLQMRIVLRGDFCDKGRKCSGEGENSFWWGDWDFTISGKSDNFRLSNLKYLRGNLSDPDKPSADIFTQMSNNQPFTTVDKDNDSHAHRNGASFRHKGAWWHKDSTLVSLNGNYGTNSNVAEGQSFFWSNSKGSAYNIKPIVSMIMFRIKS